MIVNLEDFVAGDLRIAVQAAPPGGVRLHWLGRSSDRQPVRLLAPLFAAVLTQAGATGGTIAMHFERLEHFNSSTITALIQLIRSARKRHLRLILTYDASLAWQRLSFDALRVFQTPDGLLVLNPSPGHGEQGQGESTS